MTVFKGVALAGILMSAVAVTPAQAIVVEKTASYNNHTYYLLSADTWTASEAYAQTLGGHLVTINSTAENSWVYNTFTNPNTNDVNLWIGLNDVASEGHYVWTSGEAVTYTNWNAGEPNNYGNEDYVHLWYSTHSAASRWNDLPNATGIDGRAMKGVVEINGIASVPEPVTVSLLGFGLAAFGAARRRQMVSA